MNSCYYKTACSISNELKSKMQIKAASSCDQNDLNIRGKVLSFMGISSECVIIRITTVAQILK